MDGGLRVKEGEILVTFGISGSLKRDLPLATIPIYLKLDLGGEGSGGNAKQREEKRGASFHAAPPSESGK